VWERYPLYDKHVLIGEFGRSLRGTQGAALDVCLEQISAALELTAALLYSIVRGVAAGVVWAAISAFTLSAVNFAHLISGAVGITWWMTLIPDLAISLLVMACIPAGDRLHDRLDATRKQL